MANPSTAFFYWYRRYKVRAVDMTAFQQALIEITRGMSEGSVGAAVLKGLDVAPAGGYTVGVQSGIATAASGYLEVLGSSGTVDLSSLSGGSLPSRSLVVLRADPEDANFIPSPTDPFTMVPLNQVQGASLVLLPGVSGQNPDYPARGANDVVLCGVLMRPGATGVNDSMLDFEVRDSVGKNSNLTQNVGTFENRLRSFRSSPKVIGIKSSQTSGANPLLLSYPGKATPSLFPLSGGVHNNDDTFVDMSTGMISGGDGLTPSFVPSVPSGSGALVAVIGLNTDDTLSFSFGTQGSYEDCLNAIENQVTSGPGALPNTGGVYPICYSILTSIGGNLSDVQVFDARPQGGGGGGGGAAPIFVQETPTGAVDGSNVIYGLSKKPKDTNSVLVFIDDVAVPITDFSVSGQTVTLDVSQTPQPAQSVYVYYVTDGPSSVAGFQEVPSGSVDGSNDTFTFSGVPMNKACVIAFLDGVAVESDEWELLQGTGASKIIFQPGSIPQPGQSPYVFYMVNVAATGSGGGGGSGSGGYTVFGDSSPIVVDPTAGVGVAPAVQRQLRFVIGQPSGGEEAVSSNPQIQAGTIVGQELVLAGSDDNDYPTLDTGNGLLQNGVVRLKSKQSIEYFWTGTVWREKGRT